MLGLATRQRRCRRLVEPERRVGVHDAAAMAEDRSVEVAGEEAVEHVRWLAVGRVEALPAQQLDQDRPDRWEVEEADDLERERLAARILIHPVAALLPAELGKERGALVRVELVGRVCVEESI